MGENQERTFGGESPLFRPIDGQNDVIANLFRPKLWQSKLLKIAEQMLL